MRRFRPSRLMLFGLVAALVAPAAAQPIPLDALMRGGRIHYEGQRYERAREQFTKALDQYGAQADNSTLAQIHTWVGLCDAQLRDFAAAAEHFSTALEKDTSYAAKIRRDEQWQYLVWTALINATREDYNRGQYEPALRYALDALKIDPEKPQTYALVANIYSALGNYEEMRRVADELLKLNPGSPEAFSLLGLYFLEKPDSLWLGREAKLARWDSSVYYYNQAIAQYEDRFNKTKAALRDSLRISDPARLDQISWSLIEKSRVADQSELKRYIEKDLNAANRLPAVAQAASQLFFAANNVNAASSRAGTAALRAAAETRGDTSEKFRGEAEVLFGKAVEYDSSDFTALFDLGIAQYQGRKDSLAEMTLQRVVNGATVPIAGLPAGVLNELLSLVTPDAAKTGYLEISGPLTGKIDSALLAQGHVAGGYNWFYFPDLKGRKDFTAAIPADAPGMFLSLEQPQLLEQAYLWLGSSQTGLGTVMDTLNHKDARVALFNRAIGNLQMAVKLSPQTPDAYQNLGICYRELGQKEKALNAFETAEKIKKMK